MSYALEPSMTSLRSVPTHGPPPRSHLFVGSGGRIGGSQADAAPPAKSRAAAPAHTSKTNLRILTILQLGGASAPGTGKATRGSVPEKPRSGTSEKPHKANLEDLG